MRRTLPLTILAAALLFPAASFAAETATGVVYHDTNANKQYDPGTDKPLEGIGVTNGRTVVETNSQGRYELPVTDDTILFVIKPSGWRTPINKNMIPKFYYIHKPEGSPDLKYPGVEPTGPLPESVDFPLYKRQEPERFEVILFGDPQPRNQKEIDYIGHDVVEQLVGTDAAFGVTLGDIMFDNLNLFRSSNRMTARLGIPWRHVIGNHDIDFTSHNDRYSDETFESVYGPSYYSFNYGEAHFIALDDVDWINVETDDGERRRHYRTALGEDQLNFIREDLKRVPKDKLVVLMMHIPLVDSTPWKNEKERQELFRLMEQRPFCVSVSGHTHHHEHRMIDEEDGWKGEEPHHHIINVTASGSWWRGIPDEYDIPHTMMKDGAPNGYSIMTIDENDYSLRFRAARRPADFQMHISAPEAVPSNKAGDTDIFANVFNARKKAKVSMKLGRDGDWVEMERDVRTDPRYARMLRRERKLQEELQDQDWIVSPGPKPSPHLWRGSLPANPPAGTHLIHIKAENPDGRMWKDQRIIRIKPAE